MEVLLERTSAIDHVSVNVAEIPQAEQVVVESELAFHISDTDSHV